MLSKIYTQMPKHQLADKAAKLHYVASALLEYIDALPQDVVDRLPAMPGISRDYVEEALSIL